jgi:hypothetical protein
MQNQVNPVLIDKNHAIPAGRIYEVYGDEKGMAVVVFYDNDNNLITLHSSYTFVTVYNAWCVIVAPPGR